MKKKVAVEKEVKPEHGERSISEVKGCGDAFANQREEKREKQIEIHLRPGHQWEDSVTVGR